MRGTRGIVAFHSDMTRSIVFAVIALVFGAAYALRTPAFEVPDEVALYWRATAAAYGHLVVGERVGLPRGYRVIVWALTLTPDDNRVTSERLRKARGVLLQDEFRDKTPVAGLYSPATYVPQIVAAARSRAGRTARRSFPATALFPRKLECGGHAAAPPARPAHSILAVAWLSLCKPPYVLIALLLLVPPASRRFQG